MIERHVSFSVRPGRTTDFEQFFNEQYRPPCLAMPGLVECLLLRESTESTHYQIVFRWDTAESAAAWRTSAVHEALQPALEALHEGMSIVAYERVA
jgi:heme-degrading monooxygenase HmoA